MRMPVASIGGYKETTFAQSEFGSIGGIKSIWRKTKNVVSDAGSAVVDGVSAGARMTYNATGDFVDWQKETYSDAISLMVDSDVPVLREIGSKTRSYTDAYSTFWDGVTDLFTSDSDSESTPNISENAASGGQALLVVGAVGLIAYMVFKK